MKSGKVISTGVKMKENEKQCVTQNKHLSLPDLLRDTLLILVP